ncbi:MAG: trehalose-6-phosphate synthase, partial [Dongiaceae bacterium]
MARLVVISNRVAAPRERSARAGGLAVALREALAQRGGLWFGWSGEVADGADHKPHLVQSGRITYATIDLGPTEHQAYYVDVANGVLWPMFHYRPGLVAFRRDAFEGYVRVNATFARELLPLLRPDDVIWVHDYHFIPFAVELRRLGVANRIGFFLHIPFPAPE